jgi:hypothetical protein
VDDPYHPADNLLDAINGDHGQVWVEEDRVAAVEYVAGAQALAPIRISGQLAWAASVRGNPSMSA